MTPEGFREKVEVEWASIKNGPGTLTLQEINRAKSSFSPPEYDVLTDINPEETLISDSEAFKNWLKQNVIAHKIPGYAIVNVAIKATGVAPGDMTDEQMELVADLADAFSFGELRVTHEQNITLADVKQKDLYSLWQRLVSAKLDSPNLGLLTDMICCPGGDFCSLANAKSIPVAEAIQRRFDQLDYLHDLGELRINISGCMNACGHHHVGNIGILGVDKKGEEFFQVSIGGSANASAAIGKILGPSFALVEIPQVIVSIVQVFVSNRISEEQFLDTLNRIGVQPFKDAVYRKDD